MKIEFTGRQTEIPNEVRRLVERKLLKVAKVLPGLTRAHVILTADKHRRIAEVSAHSRRVDLSAIEVSTSPRLSLSNALEKLLRQAQRQHDKRRYRKGASSPRRMETPGVAASPEDGTPRLVVRRRRLAVKPMTLDEAALEVEEQADGVVVYRDASTERVRVLYRRKDGNLGLIEPEV
jgi:ribosome hibernation promoting factor